ncbi:Putative multidrug export ATP-binding/permease protein SAV1866 [uncultured Eubacterium sp.]|uniref:ABC transporter ATP-binding protein n=1 Tax=Brotomerdimonas butyrica TaxID=2981721 RepID=UPI0008209A50|nr:ABC transporter ATP-binding protein [Brotomerdimonas butyrica]MCU6755586.1 ABC transporter ATP-binding protein/permease [Brotomerdimonas butyrica]SCH38787.1 Putative multidrug export ATP-binding/permease protein SAV1866 [uncultured Eubacterium sp.]
MAERRKGPGRPGGPGGRMMPGEKAKDFGKTMKTLIGYLKPYKFRLAIVFIFAIASTVFTIISPTILGDATDKVVEGLMSGMGIDFSGLASILFLLLALYGCSLLFGVVQGWIMADVSQKVIYNLRDKMSTKLDRLPLRYFDSRTHGEIQSRMINDIETVNQTLSVSLTQMITSFTTIVGILIMMLRISVVMTLMALVVLPLSMGVIRLVVSKSQGHFKNQQKYLGYVNGHVEEMYAGHDIVKAFNREEESQQVFEEYNDKLCESAWKSQFLSGMMMPITNFIGNLAYVAVCLLGGYLAINGKISIGDIQAFIQYVRSFNQPIAQVANVANQLQSTAAAAERIFEIIDEEEEVDIDTAPEEVIDVDHVKGQVAFEHVHFGYTPEETVISDFSFTAQPGQRVAIVGPTGAGKTTIVKLLMRFYELDGGRIMIDGCDITKLSRANLREMFGMVLQDTWLNNGTIRDNIRYGRPDATDEEVEAAAKAAHVDHFIKTQGKGYDMEVNEEATNISQGQKQLLTIARAFLADAPILILDEATSSVDTRTESLIQKAMTSLMQGRTSFIIAHRLSTIRDADHILVLDHGDIIEQGTHEELLAANGFYTNLYNSQFAK